MYKVIIYTTPTCAFCKQVKAFYQENGIEYEEKDVAVDTAAAEEMVDISHQMGVPVSVIGEGDDKQVVIGFDRTKLSEILDIK